MQAIPERVQQVTLVLSIYDEDQILSNTDTRPAGSDGDGSLKRILDVMLAEQQERLAVNQ